MKRTEYTKKRMFRVILLAAIAASTSPVWAVTVSQDFESTTPPDVPTNWTTIGTNGSGTYATTAATGNPGQSGNLDWTGANTAYPSVYLLNEGLPFDAAKSISGTFDFYVVEDGNYSSVHFVIGDVIDAVTATSTGEFLNVQLQERTFGARANIRAGDGTLLFDGSGNNTYQIETDQWYSGSFTWTPTNGLTGDFSFSWTGAQGNKGPMTANGYTFDSPEVYFGFGTGKSPARYDNISLTGSEISGVGTVFLFQ